MLYRVRLLQTKTFSRLRMYALSVLHCYNLLLPMNRASFMSLSSMCGTIFSCSPLLFSRSPKPIFHAQWLSFSSPLLTPFKTLTIYLQIVSKSFVAMEAAADGQLYFISYLRLVRPLYIQVLVIGRNIANAIAQISYYPKYSLESIFLDCKRVRG